MHVEQQHLHDVQRTTTHKVMASCIVYCVGVTAQKARAKTCMEALHSLTLAFCTVTPMQ